MIVDYERWSHNKPKSTDFGISSQEIRFIEEAKERYNNLSYFKPSDELLQLKKQFESMKYRELGNISFVLSFIIVILVVTAFMTNGFRNFSWEKLGFAYILVMAVGIFAVSIVLNVLDRFITDPIERKINKNYSDTAMRIKDLENSEQEAFLDTVNKKYERYYDKVEQLDAYYAAQEYFERCHSKQNYEYWESKQGGNGNDFERACAEYLTDRGFNARVTKVGPDGGIDIIADRGTKKYACQCKALETKVSSGDMQKLVGVLVMGPYDAGIFFSLNGFSDKAKKIARSSPKRIYYLDKDDLVSGIMFT